MCIKVRLSPSQRNCFIYSSESPLKMMKICFFFHLTSFFHSHDISIFVLTFWSCRKNGSIRKIRIVSNLKCHNLVNKQLEYTYQDLFQQFIARNSHMHSTALSKYFQNLYSFAQIFKYFALFAFFNILLLFFCPFSEKSHTCPF